MIQAFFPYDGDYSPPVLLRYIDDLGRIDRNLVGLTMYFVIFNSIHPHRLKCAEADVQSDLRDFNSLVTDGFQEFGREM